MLDIKLIRSNLEDVRTRTAHKKVEVDFERLLELDETIRDIQAATDKLRQERKQLSGEIGKKMKAGENADDLKNRAGAIGDEISANDTRTTGARAAYQELLSQVPNLIHDSVPVGDESANEEVHRRGEPRKFDFPVKDHLEVLEGLGYIDMIRGAKITGSGFPVLKGPGAALVRSLVQYFLETHTEKNGYTEMQVPLLVNRDSAFASGQLPDKEGQMYRTVDEEFYLIPTSELSLVNYFREEVVESLPVYVTAYTPCFRREAGADGKNVRGLNRLHQFDKVEMVKIVHPDTSYDELESMTRQAEELLEAMELPYRRLLLASGDMGMTQSKTYDLELWSPAQERWLEISSCSNCTDYQARRANIKWRDPEDKKLKFTHTLNGSGLALPRLIIALMENHQNEDGTVNVPAVLQKYLGREKLEAIS